MLFNSDDNNKSNIDSSGNSKRLFGAEDATFDESNAASSNKDSLFASSMSDSANGANSEGGSLFNSSFNPDEIDGEDFFADLDQALPESDVDTSNSSGNIQSSFVVSFKANDPINTVSGVINDSNSNDEFQFDDDLADLDIPDDVSPFKPAFASQKEDVKSEPANLEVPSFPAKPVSPVSEPVIPETPDTPADEESQDSASLFDSGKELDFAGSTVDNKTSPFANAKAPELTHSSDEPSVSFNSEFSTDDDLSVEEDVRKDISVETKEVDKAPEDTDVVASTTVADESSSLFSENDEITHESKLTTFGKVTSGVNAFSYKPSVSSGNIPHEASLFAKSDDKVSDAAPANSSVPFATVNAAPSAKISPRNEPATSLSQRRAVRGATSEEAKSSEGGADSASSDVKVVDPSNKLSHRPGTVNASEKASARKGVSDAAPIKRTSSRPTHSANASRAVDVSERPISPKYSAASQKGNIQPVTQMDSKKRKRRDRVRGEGGISGIVWLLVVIILFGALIYVLTNMDQISSLLGIETSSITETTASVSSTTIPEASTEDTKEPTEESTEATTRATTATTTTATEEPTEESSDTSATTTSATTTTTRSTSGNPVLTFYSGIDNAATTSTGFSFDLTLQNYGTVDAVLADSVLSIRITLSTNQDITGISSQYYTFTEDPSSANTYIGTPTSGTITAGETLNMTINVATSSPVTTFLVSSYYFDWND